MIQNRLQKGETLPGVVQCMVYGVTGRGRVWRLQIALSLPKCGVTLSKGRVMRHR